MTISEFSNEFDIHYDNITSKSAPGLDLYEKSVFLSKAQSEIVKNYSNPQGNKYKKGFEGSEKRREDLKELLVNYKTSIVIVDATKNIETSSVFIPVPDDIFEIKQESVLISSTNTSLDNKQITVVPKTHDEYGIQKDNPFKVPSKDIVWRLDYAEIANNKVVELISAYVIKEYRVRYLKIPSPIILTDLTSGDFTGMGLSIDGKTSPSTSALSDSIHREILSRAVELAVLDYKPAELNPRVQLGIRNE